MVLSRAVQVTTALDVLLACGASLVRPGADGSVVHDIVLQVPGDPVPSTAAVVLWADVEGPVPQVPVVVLRPSDVGAADRLPPGAAVLTIPGDERWTDLQDRLRTRVFASGAADLFGMADALAVAVGGAVAVEDAERRILAFSTIAGQPIDEVRRQGILGRRVPKHVERDGWYAQLWRSEEPLQLDGGPESWPRLALGLGGQDEPVGSVWVVGDATTLHPDSAATLTASGPAFAAAVAAVIGTRGRTREQRNRLVDRVLRAPAPTELEPLMPAVVVGVDLGQDGNELDDLRRARLSDVLALRAQRTESMGLAGEVGEHVVAVLPFPSEEALEASVTALVQRIGVRSSAVAVSEPVAPGEPLVDALAQVTALLSLGASDEHPVRFAARSRPLVALLRIGAVLSAAGALPAAGGAALAASDAEHGTRYAESLQALLDAHGDVNRAASLLHVHGNTLRYRIGRAVQLFGLDLDDSQARLLLHLDLQLRSLGHGA